MTQIPGFDWPVCVGTVYKTKEAAPIYIFVVSLGERETERQGKIEELDRGFCKAKSFHSHF